MNQQEGIQVGLLDSGVGGMSVFRVFARRFPGLDLIYYGDRMNAPYGDRPSQQVERLSEHLGEWLAAKGIDHLVLACNTISCLNVTWPAGAEVHNIVGAGVVMAARAAPSGKVGLIATRNTVSSGGWPFFAEQRGLDLEFVSSPCQQLVPLIEAGRLEGAEVEAVVRKCLEPVVAEGVEALVLGCTHFPLAEGAVRKVLAELGAGDVTVVDPAEAVVQSVVSALPEEFDPESGEGVREVYFSGEAEVDWLREAIPELRGADIITGCNLIKASELEVNESTGARRESSAK